ncbi:MAG: type I DNA topoisomerase [Acidobacteria bacterium]|nr:type I DNA topoisomerase [Acidobacteriota bacterium]
MAKTLVVVESPAKARTINRYLGKDYKVVASMGHIRDLPKTRLGVDVEAGFSPAYEPIPARKKVIKQLKDAAKGVSRIYVATDPDREGEAIGWHLAREVGAKKQVGRLMFNEITRTAVSAALDRVGEIDQRMVDAQQARRVLDRLVGYKLSPLLWDKVQRGLSAGRVQSVALKLVCDREAAIDAFEVEEYWHVTARLAAGLPPEFDARLVKKGKQAVKLGKEAEAKAVVADLERATYVVETVTEKERKRHAAPPFITSKLQQAARFPVKRTMQVAQQLYEGIEIPGEGSVGLITYMRTDSTRVSEEAIASVRDHITSTYGPEFLPAQPKRYRAGKDAQDAHEAIRPTSMALDPAAVRPHLTREQAYLYELVWNRFVASQMPPATFDDTTVEVRAGDYLLRAKGSVPKFSGWLAVYERTPQAGSEPETPGDAGKGSEEAGATGLLPAVRENDRLDLKGLRPEQKFTQPPPRFGEATLVKELEENGIGRPTTYASIIGTLQMRDYVEKLEGRFKPTRLGRLVTDLLTRSFDDIIQVAYTRELEDRLDRIAEGQADYQGTLASFYEKFRTDLERAATAMPNVKAEGLPSDETCDKCGSKMVRKIGRFGMFLACSAYPECQNTREIEPADTAAGEEQEEESCDTCGRPMVVKRGRFGQFLACSGYPECKTTRKLIATAKGVAAAKPDRPLDEPCPKCGTHLIVKHGRFGEFTACSNYPKCRYVKLESTGVACPRDGGDLVERKSRRGRVFYGCSNYPDCDFTLWNKPLATPCPKCRAPFLLEKVTKRWGRQLLCHNDDCDYQHDDEERAAG